jgi:hypothetical protein
MQNAGISFSGVSRFTRPGGQLAYSEMVSFLPAEPGMINTFLGKTAH